MPEDVLLTRPGSQSGPQIAVDSCAHPKAKRLGFLGVVVALVNQGLISHGQQRQAKFFGQFHASSRLAQRGRTHGTFRRYPQLMAFIAEMVLETAMFVTLGPIGWWGGAGQLVS
ncbi:hypothetical protein GCM10009582_30890 [Arthrobacter flavus]